MHSHVILSGCSPESLELNKVDSPHYGEDGSTIYPYHLTVGRENGSSVVILFDSFGDVTSWINKLVSMHEAVFYAS